MLIVLAVRWAKTSQLARPLLRTLALTVLLQTKGGIVGAEVSLVEGAA
jgi:hypothetical protein